MVHKLAFIGAGSMAEAIIAGVVKNNVLPSKNIFVSNRSNKDRLVELKEKYRITGTHDKEEAIKDADAIIISPKPNDIASALHEIKPYIQQNQLIISVVAGVTAEKITALIGKDVAVIRAMPNTSAMIGRSATGLARGRFATDNHLHIAKSIFSSIGTVVVIEEADMHILTAISGSGPAYIYYLVEAMEEAAKAGGLEADVAKELIVQTIIGAGEMLKSSTDSASELRRKVTSPNGVTEAGIKALSNYKFQEAMQACVQSAVRRSIQLGEEN